MLMLFYTSIKMKAYNHPGLINTSQGGFFICFALLMSLVLSQPFESYDRAVASAVIFLWALLFYFVWKLLKQFNNINYLTVFLMTFILFPTAMGLILNQIVGPLGLGTVPVFYGPGRLIKDVMVVQLYPAVLIQYGMTALLVAGFLSGMTEKIYEAFVIKLLPKNIANRLYKLDRSLDKTSVKTSDSLFIISNRGLLLGLAALVIHGVLIVLLLR